MSQPSEHEAWPPAPTLEPPKKSAPPPRPWLARTFGAVSLCCALVSAALLIDSLMLHAKPFLAQVLLAAAAAIFGRYGRASRIGRLGRALGLNLWIIYAFQIFWSIAYR